MIIHFETSDGGTAVRGPSCGPGIDYVQASFNVVFQAQQNEAAVPIVLCNDGVPEPIETVNLLISGNYALEPTMAVLYIGDPDLRISVSGRVTTASGFGIRNAAIDIYANYPESAPPGHATTGSFGWYSVDGMELGHNYTVYVNNRRYTFTPSSQVINFSLTDITDINFTADP